MAPSDEDKQPTDTAERGVLTSLPSTRPQRPSARRAAARDAAAKVRPATTPSQPAGDGEASKLAEPAAASRGRARAGTRARRASKRTATARTPRAASSQQPPTPPRQAAPRRPRTPPQTPPEQPRIPPQGFETEDEITPGATVQPPSRPELAAAVADLFGELAQGGLTAGGRLIKDFLGKLPGV